MRNLVCSLETAQKLHKLNALGETFFYWCNIGGEWVVGTKELAKTADEAIAAPTSTECTDRFPSEIWLTVGTGLRRREGAFFFAKHNDIYKTSLMVKTKGSADFTEVYREEHTSQPEANAKMLEYLAKNNM